MATQPTTRSKAPAHHGHDHGTTIGSEIQVRGRVEGQEDLRVQGRVDGVIVITETVHVEASAVVRAEIQARDVVVAGIVVGNIRAEDSITLQAGARVSGNLAAARLIIADGAALSGEVEMTGAPVVRERALRARVDASVGSGSGNRVQAAAPRRDAAVGSRGSASTRAATATAPTPTPATKREDPTPPSPRTSNEEQTVVLRHVEVGRDAPKSAAGSAKPTSDDGKRAMPPQLAAALAARRAAASAKTEDKGPSGQGPRPRVTDRGRRRVNRR